MAAPPDTRWVVVRTAAKPAKRAAAEILGRDGRPAFWLSVASGGRQLAAGETALTRADGFKRAWALIEVARALGGRRLAALGDHSAGAERVWARVIADASSALLTIAPGGSAGALRVSRRLYARWKQRNPAFVATAAVGPVEIPVGFARSLLAWASGQR